MVSCEIGTIRQIHHRLRQEGVCVGEATLRLWVKDGRLPAVYTGRTKKRALIHHQNVLKILDMGSTESTYRMP